MNPALLLAFEAGTLLGFVQHDQQIERGSITDAATCYLYDKKTAMPLHVVAPVEGQRPVRHLLMSNQRREYLVTKAKAGLADAQDLLKRLSEVAV